MGRLIGLVVFAVFFVIFAIIKFVAQGAKDAYEKVLISTKKRKKLFLVSYTVLCSMFVSRKWKEILRLR